MKNAMTLRGPVVRNITDPAQKELGIQHLVMKVNPAGVLKFSTDDNVRDFLAENGGRMTKVMRDIYNTLTINPLHFSTLSSGVVIGCKSLEVDGGVVSMVAPSILNGAQTHGVIKTVEDQIDAGELGREPAWTTVEVIATKDLDVMLELTIARNNQHKVQTYSICARKGVFDEVAKIMADADIRFKMKESDDSNYPIITTLLKVLLLLTPDDMLTCVDLKTKSQVYSGVSRTLSIWERVCEHQDADEDCGRLWNLWCDLAVHAWDLYESWRTDEELSYRLRTVDRSTGVPIAPDGMVFPVLAFLSKFVYYANRNRKWKIKDTSGYHNFIVKMMRSAYKRSGSNPSAMGKSQSTYTDLTDAFDAAQLINA